MARGARRIEFDKAALIADLEQISIEKTAPLHGMTSRTLYRRMREDPDLREAASRRQTFRDRRGERYGRWLILRPGRFYREGARQDSRMMWVARCLDCGRTSEVRIHNLRYGRSKRCLSCASKQRERELRRTHRGRYALRGGGQGVARVKLARRASH